MNATPSRAALYARVSTDAQVKGRTIESQLDALAQRMRDDGFAPDPDHRFVDDGYSGSTLIRPALERLRDLAALGGLDRLYVHSPDRLARAYAYQMLLVDEFRRGGVSLVFLNHPIGQSPEDHLLLQMQGMMAEYERAKILERSRRGKLHAARAGRVSAFGKAPYGYRYVGKADGSGAARWEIHADEAAVVRNLFHWMGIEGCSLAEIGRRLKKGGIRTQTGLEVWLSRTIWGMLKNDAYMGTAYFNKTASGERRTRLRPHRGHPQLPRRYRTITATPRSQQIPVPVPAIVTEEVFRAAQERLLENKKRNRRAPQGIRYLLQGLVVCRDCGYAYCGQSTERKRAGGTAKYQYYLCTGSMFGRCDRERVCWNKSVRLDRLDGAVWNDVRSLLNDPGRVEAEYRRRRANEPSTAGVPGDGIERLLRAGQRRIARLVDAYEDGLLDKGEFEIRIRRARERVVQLEAEAANERARRSSEEDLRRVLGQLDGFARSVGDRLGSADWSTRREVIRALVKRIEAGKWSSAYSEGERTSMISSNGQVALRSQSDSRLCGELTPVGFGGEVIVSRLPLRVSGSMS